MNSSVNKVPLEAASGGCPIEADAIAAASQAAARQIDFAMGRAYLSMLAKPDAVEQHRFAPLIDWGMRVLRDDDLLLDTFSISRATLKRWATGGTTPGPLARETVIGRMEKTMRERLGIVEAGPRDDVDIGQEQEAAY